MKRKNIIYKVIILVVVLLIVIFIFTNMLKFEEVEVPKEEKEETKEEVKEENEEEIKEIVVTEDYFMTLDIPKIGLYKGLYEINNSKNNVNLNIEILKESDMPDVEKGNLILIGHSGSSEVAYFNDLDLLEIGDFIYIYYNYKTYIYNLVNIYDVEKTGQITIHRDNEQTVLVLITCKKYTDDKQTVYIANLVDIQEGK